MIDINSIIASQLDIQNRQVESVIQLRAEGGTMPFIARYRKEKTGNLDENYIRDIFDKFDYYTELEDRKQTILKSIEEQGKLTDELRLKIENCLQKNELEDLYLPYKPKRRTKATIAKEKGLEPLAIKIKEHNQFACDNIDLLEEAGKFVDAEKQVNSAAEALQGASDIIAEEISEVPELRKWVREYLEKASIVTASIKDEFPEGTTKYENYRKYEKSIIEVPSHAFLALRRGETEGVINLDLKFEELDIMNYMQNMIIKSNRNNLIEFYEKTIKDSFNRLIKNSIIGEVRLLKKQDADSAAISVFEANLRQILLSSPAGLKPTLGVDPGFRTGCKIVALDGTGKLMEYFTIFPHNSDGEKTKARNNIIRAIQTYKIELIAIGNGTASRETDKFISDVISDLPKKPIKVIVNESGASIYSASEVAQREFPDLDLTVRGAASIGRRLQDPLAELVKIDPKSIGVGQYQHDVDQKLLKKKLEETVISCVNYVGVDLNSASRELLIYVSGINSKTAENILEYRNQNGAFKNRKQLMKVPKFGDKAFELSAGFLRIANGDNPLDNTAVHPESYFVVEKIAKELNISLKEINKISDKIKTIDIKKFVDEKVGELTLKDIFSELEKQGRDPREEFKYACFSDGINEIKDLKIGMTLEGVVTNITNFGCFVDCGVHQDGLVHISEMANQFVRDPSKVVKVGQIVNVTVLDVNEKLKQIKLSMKQGKPPAAASKLAKPVQAESKFSMDDLKSKFGK